MKANKRVREWVTGVQPRPQDKSLRTLVQTGQVTATYVLENSPHVKPKGNLDKWLQQRARKEKAALEAAQA